MGWNSICPRCGANIYRRVGGRTKRNFLSGLELFVCDSCGWRGKIKGGRTVMESLGRPSEQRFEYWNTNDDAASIFTPTYWWAQTFTPQMSHVISYVKLKLYREESIGTITVSIRATSGSKPTGTDLTSGILDGNTLTTDPSGAWYQIDFSPNISLSANTEYAICVRTSSGSVYWREDDIPSGYPRGDSCYSLDSGINWDINANRDLMFEEWGR